MNDATKGAIVLGTAFSLGLGAGWMLWRPKPTPPATYQPAIQQQDGSTVLEAKPDAHAKPPHQIPHGGTVEDIAHVTVLPNAEPVSPLPSGSAVSGADNTNLTSISSSLVSKPPCPPVTVDLSLVRMDDGTRRVVASSPDGQIIGAVHIPVEAAKPQPKTLKWAAGGLWNPADRTYGAFVDRDVAFLRVGAEVFQQREPIILGGRVTWAGQIKVGIRF